MPQLPAAQVDALMAAVEAITAAVKVATDGAVQGPSRRMPGSDLAALLFVGGAPGASLGEMARKLRVGLTTASSIVDRLEARGLLQRQRSDKDRRVVGLDLTPEGRALHGEAVAEARRSCETMLHALDPGERDAFVGMMQRIAAAFSQDTTILE